MRNIEDKLLLSEKQHLNNLFSACRDIFKNELIPSHNHLHHSRVWNIAKNILIEISRNKTANISSSFINGLMIAIFFHDTGLKIVRDEKHGKYSKAFCKQYLNTNKQLFFPPNFEDEILEAVEHHDDKNYTTIEPIDPSQPSLLTLLSISDDLDAFGYIGIIRYAEIYFMRGYTPKEIPEKVLYNATNRFHHFTVVFQKYPSIIQKHQSRYQILSRFYKNKTDGLERKKVIQTIYEKVISKNYRRLEDLVKDNCSVSQGFYQNLMHELKNDNPMQL